MLALRMVGDRPGSAPRGSSAHGMGLSEVTVSIRSGLIGSQTERDLWGFAAADVVQGLA